MEKFSIFIESLKTDLERWEIEFLFNKIAS